jgi:hypothetical protein
MKKKKFKIHFLPKYNDNSTLSYTIEALTGKLAERAFKKEWPRYEIKYIEEIKDV